MRDVIMNVPPHQRECKALKATSRSDDRWAEVPLSNYSSDDRELFIRLFDEYGPGPDVHPDDAIDGTTQDVYWVDGDYMVHLSHYM